MLFQYPKVRLKGVAYFKHNSVVKVSIPEGAIEGTYANANAYAYA